MSKKFTINIKNKGVVSQGLCVFQESAAFVNPATIYGNELYSHYLHSGAAMTVQIEQQIYAGLQIAYSQPMVGRNSGQRSVSRAIDLSPILSGTANDSTTATDKHGLDLSIPTPGVGVIPGMFRITAPSFVPPPFYNIGTAVNVNGKTVLSSFIQADPDATVDVMPISKFYVNIGQTSPGTVINFPPSVVNAAMCDFTGKYSVIDVTLEADGTWTVQNVS